MVFADPRVTYIGERINAVKYDILIWDSDESMIWDCEPEEASKYLKAVDEIQQLTQEMEAFHWTKADWQENDLSHHAHSILQMAMTRLEDEFVHLLVHYHQTFEPDNMSFRSSEGQASFHLPEDGITDLSINSFDENSFGGIPREDYTYNTTEDLAIDLVSSRALLDIKCIAEAMFKSNYDKECCHAYIDARKAALDERLSFLGVERLGIEEVLLMDWNTLDSKIKKWNWALKYFVRVYLANEKCLCHHIFADLSESVSKTCFLESAKSSILQLLNFGEAIGIGSVPVERLFRVLYAYEGLKDLLPDIEAFFAEESGCCVLGEYHQVLRTIGESIKRGFSKFKNAIQGNRSLTAFPGGGVHHITRYVMNYIKVLADSSETLDLLLEDLATEDVDTLSEGDRLQISCNLSPVPRHFHSIVSILESNLVGKSMAYQDASLQHLFMMNNLQYMVKKVQDGRLLEILGADWVRLKKTTYCRHAQSYERISWNPILAFLKDDGLVLPGSNSQSLEILKDRFKNFNLAFEEIYRAQTVWQIPDNDLREDLRISISAKVIQAYRAFTGRHKGNLDRMRHRGKYVKYSAEDLQNYLLDLFEGSSKTLHNHQRW